MQPNQQYSPRARRAAVVHGGLAAATRVVEYLGIKGFNIIAVDVFGNRPTIQVENCRLTAELIDNGGAAYYKHQVIEGERQRFGQFQVENCRVIWVERGH